MLPTSPHPPTARVARIIAALLAMLGARLDRPGKPGLTAPLTLAIAIRLHRIRNRLARYAARWDAGTLTPPRPRKPTPRRRPATPSNSLPQLPSGRAWLVRLVPGSGVGATQLRALLDEPEMRGMLAAAPQIGRTLRPFWHMLSADPLPEVLRPSRPAPPDPPPPAHPRPPRRPSRRLKPHRPPFPPAPEVAGTPHPHPAMPPRDAAPTRAHSIPYSQPSAAALPSARAVAKQAKSGDNAQP